MTNRELAVELARATQAIQEPAGEQDTLDTAVRVAAAMLGGQVAAGLFELGADGRSHTAAATSDLVLQADQLQRDLEEGPSLAAIGDEPIVLSQDLATEQRWPRWTAAARVETGLASVLSVQLHTGRHGHLALNLYATRTDAFDDRHQAIAITLASQIAFATTTVRREHQLARAVSHRTVIGQAQGILMERYHLTADTSFAVLIRSSQQSNTKLHAVAEELVLTRRAPAAMIDQQGPTSRAG